MMANLYVVATPIGNLEDISLRALRILKEVDLIACEDTRKTQILLQKYNIKKPLVSYFQHSKLKRVGYLISQLKKGRNIAVVCDAGTPGISDAGGKLINEVSKLHEVNIIPVPGPNAAVTVLSVSGFFADRFLYLGFLPKKKGRKKMIENLKLAVRSFGYTVIFYESPYRILKTLKEILEVVGDREVVIGRELTKIFEVIYRGKISEVLPKIKAKGEFVIVIKGNGK